MRVHGLNIQLTNSEFIKIMLKMLIFNKKKYKQILIYKNQL